MKKEDGIGYVIHCDICKRKLGGFYGKENEEEARELYQVSKVLNDDVCWKCLLAIQKQL